MIGYLIRRVLQALVVIIGVTIITFILLHMLPGNPVRAILGPRASKADVASLTRQLGLNKPLPVQYLLWLWNLAHFNLGFSYRQTATVSSLLAARIPNSLLLVGSSLVLALVLAIPLGMFQAVRRNRPDDYTLTGLAFIFYSMPTFWLGIILIIIFSATLGWLPPEAPQASASLFSQLNALILPVATLTLVTLALFSRYMRSSMLDNLVQDYVRTAKSKGVSNRRVLFRHVLRNALIPVLTLVGLSIPGVVAGAVVTETVFNYPGMGYLFFLSAQNDDFPVLLGVTLVIAIATVLGSLVADILYAVADPRIRYV
ncbi:MAG: ABC transporter permease [Candidatus Dormibacteria bacterium]|jgi:peptide/nickel transport system permease protein